MEACFDSRLGNQRVQLKQLACRTRPLETHREVSRSASQSQSVSHLLKRFPSWLNFRLIHPRRP